MTRLGALPGAPTSSRCRSITPTIVPITAPRSRAVRLHTPVNCLERASASYPPLPPPRPLEPAAQDSGTRTMTRLGALPRARTIAQFPSTQVIVPRTAPCLPAAGVRTLVRVPARVWLRFPTLPPRVLLVRGDWAFSTRTTVRRGLWGHASATVRCPLAVPHTAPRRLAARQRMGVRRAMLANAMLISVTHASAAVLLIVLQTAALSTAVTLITLLKL
mmetsp:Transcript_22268/g.40916  ORF Transcript_22268/g.40916 Transcript_22268/m.40916 type:complete len:218 (-) Transcript_22268:231-884(-)